MQMSTKYRMAFLCMPKCASTSIEAVCKRFCNIDFSGHGNVKHINARIFTENILEAHKRVLPSFKIESFCLVRDPFDWVQSWYRFRTRDEIKNPSDPNHKNYVGNISFDEFVEEFISSGKRQPYANLGTQYDFVRLKNGKVGVDRIFPMTRLDLVAEYMSEKLDRRIELPAKNVSPRLELEIESSRKERLMEFLVKDSSIYSYVNNLGVFDRKIHGAELNKQIKQIKHRTVHGGE